MVVTRMFISFASVNRDYVDKIVAMLEDDFHDTIEARVVERELHPGVAFANQVANELQESKWFLVLLTRQGAQSQWVNQELGFAERLKREGSITTIIPIVERHKDGSLLDTKGFIRSTDESVKYRRKKSEWKACLDQLKTYLAAAGTRG